MLVMALDLERQPFVFHFGLRLGEGVDGYRGFARFDFGHTFSVMAGLVPAIHVFLRAI